MARKTAHSTAMVGGFVLAALVVLIAGSLWITGSSAIFGPRDRYTVLLHDSAGIEPGDRVRVAGVSVGRVHAVHLRPDETWPVHIDVAVKPEVDIRDDARATITSEGLLGEKFLQIDPGTPERPALDASAAIPSNPQMDLERAMGRLDEITGKLSTVLDDASGMLRGASGRIDDVLDRTSGFLSDENAENLRVTLATLRETLETSGPRFEAMTADFQATSRKLDRALDDLPVVTGRIARLLDNLDAAIGTDGERLGGVLDATRSGVQSAEVALEALTANRGEIDATLADLRDAVSSLKAFSQTIKERPYSLVRVRHPADRKPGDGVEP